MTVGKLCHTEFGKEVISLFYFAEKWLKTALLLKKSTAKVSHEVDSERVV